MLHQMGAVGELAGREDGQTGPGASSSATSQRLEGSDIIADWGRALALDHERRRHVDPIQGEGEILKVFVRWTWHGKRLFLSALVILLEAPAHGQASLESHLGEDGPRCAKHGDREQPSEGLTAFVNAHLPRSRDATGDPSGGGPGRSSYCRINYLPVARITPRKEKRWPSSNCLPARLETGRLPVTLFFLAAREKVQGNQPAP